MDPLSVTASIVGILAAAGRATGCLKSIISTVKDAPQVLSALLCEINEVRIALSSLKQFLLLDLSTAPARRTALIELDHLIVTLTESVLTFSELDLIVTPFVASKGQKITFRTRLKWTRAEGSCAKIVERLQRHKASINLMLNIVQCASDLEASRSQRSLELTVTQLLESNEELCKKLRNLEATLDTRSTITKKFGAVSFVSVGDNETVTAPQFSNKRTSVLETIRIRFAFDDDLAASRVYRKMKNDSCDYSLVSSAVRTNAWSIFSGMSLADISVISVIALPIYPSDIQDHEHYSFGEEMTPESLEHHAVRTQSKAVEEIEHTQEETVMEAPSSIIKQSENSDNEGDAGTPRKSYMTNSCLRSSSLDAKETGLSSPNLTDSAPISPDTAKKAPPDAVGPLIRLSTGHSVSVGGNSTSRCDRCGVEIAEAAILTQKHTYCTKCFSCPSCEWKIDLMRHCQTPRILACRRLTRHRRDGDALLARRGRNKREMVLVGQASIDFKGLTNLPSADPRASITLARIDSPTLPVSCATCGSIADSTTTFIALADGTYICNRVFCIPKTIAGAALYGYNPPFSCITCGSAANTLEPFVQLIDGSLICNQVFCIPETVVGASLFL